MQPGVFLALVRRTAMTRPCSVSIPLAKMESLAALSAAALAFRRPPMPRLLPPISSTLGTLPTPFRCASGVDSIRYSFSKQGRSISASALKGKARDSSPSSPSNSSNSTSFSPSLPALTQGNFPQHVPVLLAEVLESFAALDEIKLYVDGTLGAGGHASALVRSLAREKNLRAVVGLDVDARARALASEALAAAAAEVSRSPSSSAGPDAPPSSPSPVIRVLDANFRDIEAALESVSGELVSEGGLSPPASSSASAAAAAAAKNPNARETTLKASAILLDLGVSSMQLDNAERGFSFAADGPLDMRLDGGGFLEEDDDGKAGPESKDFAAKKASFQKTSFVTAATIVNTWPEKDLASLFAAKEYGGERHAKLAARRIVKAREESQGGLQTTRQLASAIGRLGPPPRGGGRGGGTIHPATRVFQALRLAVNDELGALGEALPKAIDLLEPGGRLAVISFHSGEDRVVKRAFLAAAGKPVPLDDESDELKGNEQTSFVSSRRAILLSPEPPPPPPPAVARLVTRRPVVAGEEECRNNPRARSAKLRVIEKL